MSLQSSINNLSQSSNQAVISNNSSTTIVPKIKQNVFYIVSVVIFDSSMNQVVLVKEAKPSCYSKLYLPAGKVEPNENLIEAAKREVLEEAGVDVDIATLFSIEEQGIRWLRFNFLGKLKSDEIKLKSVADKETLGAEWYSVDEILELNKSFIKREFMSPGMKSFKNSFRCLDILSIIEEAHSFATTVISKNNFILTLPTSSQNYSNCSVRLIITHSKSDNKNYRRVEK